MSIKVCRGCNNHLGMAMAVSVQQLCLSCLERLDKQQKLQQQAVMLMQCKAHADRQEASVNKDNCSYSSPF